MLNNADLTELTKALLFPTTPEEMLALADDALRVLPGGAHGDNSINDAPGFVFSSVALLGNYGRARLSWGDKVPGNTDATFKLAIGGWPISVYGVPHMYYSEKKVIHTQFRPVAYMLHASETKESCTKLLECAKAGVKLVTGLDVQHSTSCTDRAIEQKTGWDRAFPEAVWTTCWPHLARKPRTEWVSRMVDKKYKETVVAHMQLLHTTRSDKQFKQLAAVVVEEWESAGEADLAAYVTKEYLTEPWDRCVLLFLVPHSVGGDMPTPTSRPSPLTLLACLHTLEPSARADERHASHYACS